MFGDPDRLRLLAWELMERADVVDARAVRLVGLVETVAWESVAAEAMRQRARREGQALGVVAGAYREAAAAVRWHATCVEQAQEDLRRAAAVLAALVPG